MSSAWNLASRALLETTLHRNSTLLSTVKDGLICGKCFNWRLHRNAAKITLCKPEYRYVHSNQFLGRGFIKATTGTATGPVNDTMKVKTTNQKRSKLQKDKEVVYFQKLEKAKLKKPVVEIPTEGISVFQLANLTNRTQDIVKDAIYFLNPDITVNRNTVLTDFDFLTRILKSLGYRWKFRPKEKTSKFTSDDNVYRSPPPTDQSQLSHRPPIVTIMGHIDHGKTTLLDSLRSTNVAQGEAGGITQAIGAFSVKASNGATITFLDTPGHAAFSSMRKRGAKLTDIVVLVVAADDGVMEQTIESIEASKLANVPMLVAVNKCDAKGAQPRQVLEELHELGIEAEELGGNIQTVNISALKKEGLDKLEECILLQAELSDLKADKKGKVEAVVLESRRQKGIGAVVSAVIQQGTIAKGKYLVAGTSMAKVKGLFDENQKSIKNAIPGDPVDIFGWKSLPNAGDEILEVTNEAHANRVIKWREGLIQKENELKDLEKIMEQREQDRSLYNQVRSTVSHKIHRRHSLTNRIEKQYIKDTDHPELNILVKADVDGSLDALLNVIDTYDSNDTCLLNLVDFGVGNLNEGDIERAHIANGYIFAFNVQPSPEIEQLAAENDVTIISNDVIYHLIGNLRQTLSKLLPKVKNYSVFGEATVGEVFDFKMSNKEIVKIAGCSVSSGELNKNMQHILSRGGEVIHEGPLSSLRHHKADVAKIKAGKDCGVLFEQDVIPEVGDTIQCCEISLVRGEIPWKPPGF